jgi:hypothetical protein
MYREDHRLRVSKNGLLRKMFGSEREGIKGAGGLHNEGLHCYLYSSATAIRTMRGVWYVEGMGKKIDA